MAQKALIPEATLTYNHPAAGGMVTEYGYSRDWRMSKLWQGRFVEYIEPLKAIAPAGTIYPQDMVLADWTIGYNQAVGEWRADTYPAAVGLKFRDGRIRAADDFPGTGPDYWASVWQSDSETLPPNAVLHTIRAVPPPGQGVIPQVSFARQGVYWDGDEWAEARLTLLIPRHNDTYRNPFLHVYVGDWDDAISVFAAGDVVSEGPGSSSNAQGATRESWVLETVEVWQDSDGYLYGEADEGLTFIRSHHLIRNTADMSAWWHWSSGAFRLNAEGQWRVNVGGAVTWCNVVPIKYGEAAGYCWAPTALDMPSATGSTWNEEASPWGGIATNVDDWTAAVSAPTGTPPGASHRPRIDFTRTGAGGTYKRPVAWLTYEEHPAVVAVPEGLPSEQTTNNTNYLRAVSYEINNQWKGAQGTAEFYPETSAPMADWVENGMVEVAVGLAPTDGSSNDPALALAQVATAYILPDGLKRSRDGSEHNGKPRLSIAFGDYAAARLQQKAIIDLRQAALRRIDGWAETVALRIGIPASAVTVDAAIADKIIPYNELPSLPNLAPRDGDSWAQHIADVERVCGIRVCFDLYGTGGMQVDTGPQKYDAGVSTISFVLDDASVALEDQIERIEVDRDGGRFRNFLKVNYGPEQNRQRAYFSEATTTRTDGIGDDWPEAIDAEQASDPTDVLATFLSDRYRWSGAVRWTGPLRRHLRPDQFVLVSVGGIGVADDTIMQIVSHRMTVSREDMTARSECLCALCVTA